MVVSPLNPILDLHWWRCVVYNIKYLIFSLYINAAEDWLEPSPILEAFEARAIRMAASGAQSLANFSNSDEGDVIMVEVSAISVLISAIPQIINRSNIARKWKGLFSEV